MNQNQQDMEVTFNDVVFAVIRRWRTVVAFCLIAALFLGGVKGVNMLNSVRHSSREQVEQSNAQQMEVYRQKVAAQKKVIARLEQNMDSQRHYLENSVLMNMDPQTCWTAKISYFVDSKIDNVQIPDPIFALLTGYQAELTSGHVMEAAAAAVDIEPQYLKELVRVTVDTKSAVSNRLLTVAVCHPDADTAEQILDVLQKEMAEVQDTITRQIGDHEVSEVTHSLIQENDIVDIVKRQDDAVKVLSNMEKSMAQAKEDLSKISKPHQQVLTVKDAAKAAVKSAILGAVLGAMAAAVWICLQYLLSDRICSGADTVRRTGVRLLGSIEKSDRKRCALDRWALSLQGRLLLPRQEALSLAAADIGSYGAGADRVLLCGDVSARQLEQMKKLLEDKLPQIQLTAGSGSLIRDVATAEKIRDCSAVVLLAQAGTSRYSVVRSQAAKVQSLNKELLGCIVLEK